jgi:HAD superfamily hydrolase (TIGR01509 family)
MRAVIFDFDGVIVDSEPIHYRTLAEALLADGVAIDEEEYRARYLAYDDREAIRVALETHGEAPELERIDRIAQRKARLFDAATPDVPLLPGVRDLVGSLARQLPLGIASGALHGEIEKILAGAGLRDAFQIVVGADDVARSKPDPETYVRAVSLLGRCAPGLRPDECLAFEDSVAGILAARAAGIRVVGVASSYPPEKLTAAHRVLGSLEGLDEAAARRLYDGGPG